MKVVSIEKRVNVDAVELLEQWLALAKEGEIVSIGMVGRIKGGGYMTGSSSTETGSEDAGMYIELGMRRLGFAYRREQD